MLQSLIQLHQSLLSKQKTPKLYSFTFKIKGCNTGTKLSQKVLSHLNSVYHKQDENFMSLFLQHGEFSLEKF